MPGKYFLIDTTKCTACRGCQVACKQWNKNVAAETEHFGVYQNPPDHDGETFRLVRFTEHPHPENSMAWYFFSDGCRHCLEPPCKKKADLIVKDAIIVNEFGAVIYTAKSKELERSANVIKQACPWSIPNWSARQAQITKCHMCHDRVAAGLTTACTKACPTGAINFGDEADMKKLAEERLAAAKKKFGRAEILDADKVRVLYLVIDEYPKYLKST